MTCKDRTGEIKNNNFGTPMKIIAYRNSDDIDVEFQDEHCYVKKHTTYINFKKGNIKNPYDKTKYGIGYLGVGKHTASINGEYNYIYDLWADMLNRCYNSNSNQTAYYGICSICEDWLNFQNFGDWYEENEYVVNGRLHIDKDILYPNCNVYSPETCLLVPQRINMLFMNKANNRGLPNGIYKTKSGKYKAQYNKSKLGVYDDLSSAYKVYANEKEKKIKFVADEYKRVIPMKVYNALYSYEVKIENDKNYNDFKE